MIWAVLKIGWPGGMNKFQAIKNPNVNEQAHQEVEAVLDLNSRFSFCVCQIFNVQIEGREFV